MAKQPDDVRSRGQSRPPAARSISAFDRPIPGLGPLIGCNFGPDWSLRIRYLSIGCLGAPMMAIAGLLHALGGCRRGCRRLALDLPDRRDGIALLECIGSDC